MIPLRKFTYVVSPEGIRISTGEGFAKQGRWFPLRPELRRIWGAAFQGLIGQAPRSSNASNGGSIAGHN